MTTTKQSAIAFLTAVLVLGATACAQKGNSGKSHTSSIVVSAAVSVENAFVKIAKIYTARTGTKVEFSFGASGVLEKQIEAGAPVDVYASAGEKEMNQLQSQQLVAAGTRADFAGNSLVLVVPADSKLKVDSFKKLAEPSVKRLAVGDPKTVPAGFYARQALQHLGLWQKLHSRLVYAEDVRQVLDYVMRDEVSAGVVYSTDVMIAHGKAQQVATAPKGTYGPIRYPIAAVKGCAHPKSAGQFIKLVLSPEGQAILKKYGFRPANAQ